MQSCRAAPDVGTQRESQNMLTIDAQVHAYERNHPGRPWHAELTGPREVTGDQMVAAMDAVGVGSAILVSPFTIYRYDASYALEVHERHSAPVRPRQAGRSCQPARCDGAKPQDGLGMASRIH